MSIVCEVCGKKAHSGNKVSHSNRKTKRRWLPNLQSVRVSISGRPKKIKVCTSCISAGKVESIKD